jgi:cell division protein FtsZ
MATSPAILLLGLGGAGCAMVNRLAPRLPAEIKILLVDTDTRALPENPAIESVQLGRAVCRGMGSGGEVAIAKASAEADDATLRRQLNGFPLVVLVSGLGGGTGSGAAPYIASLATELGSTVLAFATLPFSHEGERRQLQAKAASEELFQKTHGMVLVHNDLLLQQSGSEAGLAESFSAADRWVEGALQGLAGAFAPGALVPVDPAALRSLFAKLASPTLCAFGVAEGEGSASKAALAACDCPLAHGPGSVMKVASLFVYVVGGPTLTTGEAFEVVATVRKRFGGEASTLLCARLDPNAGTRVEVAVLGASLPPVKKPTKARKGAPDAAEAQPLFDFATDASMRRGLFGGTPMTLIDGQDVDVPTYIRKAIKLIPGP